MDINKIVRGLNYMQPVDISYLLGTYNSLYISTDFNKIVFRHVIKPKEYSVANMVIIDGNYIVEHTDYQDDIKHINFKYPYIEEVIPESMVPQSDSLFGPVTYSYKPKEIRFKPDYDEIINLCYKAIEKFGSKAHVEVAFGSYPKG